MTEDWAAKNRDHFNETASTYNSKFSKIHAQIIAEVQARLEWIGADWIDNSDSESDDADGKEGASSAAKTAEHEDRKVRFLDYACGTGSMTRALAPHVSQCLGVDISAAMVAEYNKTAQNQGIPESEMRAVVGDLIAPDEEEGELQGEEWKGFDVAAVGMGFHHFVDPGLAAKRLVQRLKVGGVLFILDFLPHGEVHSHDHGNHHGHGHGKEKEVDDGEKEKGKMKTGAHTVTHHGFSEEEIRKLFADAGAGKDFGYEVLGKGIVFMNEGKEQRRSVFMARGTKE